VIAASRPVQRPPDAKLLVVDADGEIVQARRSTLVDYLRRGDLVIANDAATLPASLAGVHLRTGAPIEVRLAGRRSLEVDAVRYFAAIVFGEGDFHTPTERRPAPPSLAPGDRLRLGPLRATIMRLLDHPRFAWLRFDGSPSDIWEGLAHHGRPIQYAHLAEPLALWDVWTPIAGLPVAFEAPSAGFSLDWRSLATMKRRGISFATITHAAGISSTGDAALDARLPFDEPYLIPRATAIAVRRAKASARRVVAVGTTVVRALEHAASARGFVREGPGIATQRIGATTHLRVVDAMISGVHEPGTSHYELLRAFVDEVTLRRVGAELEASGYRTHEFGDSVLLERQARVPEAADAPSPKSSANACRYCAAPAPMLSL